MDEAYPTRLRLGQSGADGAFCLRYDPNPRSDVQDRFEAEMSLTGKVVIVTGATGGIGHAICRRLARDGARVAAADLLRELAEAVASDLSAFGAEAVGIGVDVRRPADAERMVAETVARFGRLDALVNNAGVFLTAPVLEITEAIWDANFDVNAKGVLFCSQAAARQLIAQGEGGRIVNLASGAGRRGHPMVLAYCASKAAVISMTQSMALALAPHGITVNAVAPGIVDTPMLDDLDRQIGGSLGLPPGEHKRRMVASIPLGRIEQPDDVANAVAFLLGPDTGYVTQQTLNVDGGNFPG